MTSSLYHTLGIGAESLFASRQGVDTAGHNIANAQTEGFSRQRVEVSQRNPSETRGILIGNGVFVKNIRRVHDEFLEKHINEANEEKGKSSTRYDQLHQIESIFSPELNATVADEITGFFGAFNDLATLPEDLGIRTNVREKALNMISAFSRVDTSLRTIQGDINRRVVGEIDNVNSIVSKVAHLNVSIASMENANEAKIANDLRDQQDTLIRKLSEIMDINYYRDDKGMITLRGPSESLLVDRGWNADVQLMQKPDGTGFFDVMVSDANNGIKKNISSNIKGGNLSALIDLRDNYLNKLIGGNNELAYTLTNQVNNIHRKGFGINRYSESTNRDFFQPIISLQNAAKSIKIDDNILQNVDSISAAIGPNSPGDNVIANEMLELEQKRIMGDGKATLNEFYSDFVGGIGLETVRADHTKQANDILSGELTARKEAVSGVSVDEEAMNLLKWQTNFTASSKVITTVDEMLETVLGLKR